MSISNFNLPNLFAWINWKWYLVTFIVCYLIGLLFNHDWISFLQAYWERKKLIEFAQKKVKAAVIQADIGMGKTLLMSVLARLLPRGIKKVGFVSNIPDAEMISYADIDFRSKVPKKDTFRIRKYFFIDETNFWIEGVNIKENREYHAGVEELLQISRHHRTHTWISATRGNHVWVAMREILNYYVELGGVEPLFNFRSYQFFTLRVKFYSQKWELKKEFNILISNLDFDLYDSYWLKDTSYWRIADGEYNLISKK